MSIATQIQRLQQAKTGIKAAISDKGVIIPDNATIDTYPTYVSQISSGSGGSGDGDFIDMIERDITSVIIPDGTTKIGSGAFSYCSKLTSVIIPESVRSIWSGGLQYCTALKEVTIPNSITSIQTWAFQHCSALTSITILAATPPTLGTSVFDDTNNCPIYVPYASVSAYRAATNWTYYSSRIQPIPTE